VNLDICIIYLFINTGIFSVENIPTAIKNKYNLPNPISYILLAWQLRAAEQHGNIFVDKQDEGILGAQLRFISIFNFQLSNSFPSNRSRI
jgi:hypothetical protein